MIKKEEKIQTLFYDYSKKYPDERIIKDGIVKEGKTTILFILKESNTGNNGNEYSTENYTTNNCNKDFFWFKEVYNAKKSGEKYYNHKNCNRVEKAAQTKYYNCIMGIVEKLYPNNQDIEIAYININKNGGGSTSDGKGIEKWLKENSDEKKFLIDQIKELNPSKIVIFSCNNTNKLIMEFAEKLKNDCNYCVYGADFHPSRYSKDYELNKL